MVGSRTTLPSPHLYSTGLVRHLQQHIPLLRSARTPPLPRSMALTETPSDVETKASSKKKEARSGLTFWRRSIRSPMRIRDSLAKGPCHASPDRVPVDMGSRIFSGSTNEVLGRIERPTGDRTQCLRALDRMNINHLS